MDDDDIRFIMLLYRDMFYIAGILLAIIFLIREIIKQWT